MCEELLDSELREPNSRCNGWSWAAASKRWPVGTWCAKLLLSGMQCVCAVTLDLCHLFPLTVLSCLQHRVLTQDLTQFVQSLLHLGNAGELGLQALLLLSQREPSCCVQLLEPPASLTVKLQQMCVVLPVPCGKNEYNKVSHQVAILLSIHMEQRWWESS